MWGAVSVLNDWAPGLGAGCPGLVLLLLLFFFWFRVVIDENQRGLYNLEVDRSFRMGMMWFIISEVLFFAVFFGALFYARNLSIPWLGGEGVKIFNKLLLWQNYDAAWPTNGPGVIGGKADGTFETIPGVRPAGDQHRHPADLGRDHHHRAPRAARRQARRC